MTHRPTVMVVEDDPTMLMLLEDVLAGSFRVVCADSGEACLARFAAEQPAIVLLDVEMPGIDGYATCRRIKEQQPELPVVFISGGERIEDRLRGYDAGGEDYLQKPVVPDELLAKVAVILKAAADRKSLQEAVQYASSTAMTAMSSMGEMGTLLQALQRFNRCASNESLVEAVIRALSDYGLTGMVWVHAGAGQDSVMRSNRGEVSPIERSVIQQVATMGRIVEYRSRMSVSYERVVLLVNNAPLDDQDRRGRLRDHLAVLIEGADVRAFAIEKDRLIAQTMGRSSQMLAIIDESQRQMLNATNLALVTMSTQLEQAYVSAALSEGQESYMAGIVEAGVEQVRRILAAETRIQEQMSAIVGELGRLQG